MGHARPSKNAPSILEDQELDLAEDARQFVKDFFEGFHKTMAEFNRIYGDRDKGLDDDDLNEYFG